MSDHSLSLLGAGELVAGYASGEFTPVDATRAALDAIEDLNGTVNAVLFTDPEGALAAAHESARRWASGQTLGPADGVPATIKDMLLTTGWPTLRGSSLVDDAGPWDVDAPTVARLRESGSIFLGKTTTPEFAWKGVTDSIRHGVTGNPWGAHLTAGGSSGGSATAVGLGMGAWSVGTDGGGSVRIPASFTGTVALKPTYGRVPIFPPSAYGTLSHAGPMTRNVTDAALLLDILSGPDARDWSALPAPTGSFVDGLDAGVAGLRIGFSPDLGYGRNDPEVDAAVRAAAARLAELGAHVEEVGPAQLGGWGDPLDAFHRLWFPAARLVVGAFGSDALERIDPGLAEGIRTYGECTAAEYLEANAVRMAMGSAMGVFHETYDVLITPTMPIPAFPAGQAAPDGWPTPLWSTWTPYTYPFNMTQQPALSLPCGLTADERPIGLQVVGPRHGDALVLRVGRAYEAATDWHRHLPALLRR
ncbi:amidase [Agilicoccus flavus]|uniref:amidase n=1 Tax=Agilicoccus flavus TaxID=2775968 RepID=UPI001CF6E971|nr:amidase [Agilicoccus flavus]